jgi:hypothetical protein
MLAVGALAQVKFGSEEHFDVYPTREIDHLVGLLVGVEPTRYHGNLTFVWKILVKGEVHKICEADLREVDGSKKV